MNEKILIIDDEKDIREGIGTALELNNFIVYSAENGEEGLKIAKKVIPDLILCDILMPNKDGYWVLENTIKDEKLFSIPFIFITAKTDREDLRKGMNLGADDYITKPFNIRELMRAIETRFVKSEQYKSLQQENKRKESHKNFEKFILLNTGKSIEPFQIDSIECIIGGNSASQVYLNNKKIIPAKKSITEWEKVLPVKTFVRVHRGTIINLEYVKSIEKWFNQTMKITMQNCDKPITMSRSYAAKLKGIILV